MKVIHTVRAKIFKCIGVLVFCEGIVLYFAYSATSHFPDYRYKEYPTKNMHIAGKALFLAYLYCDLHICYKTFKLPRNVKKRIKSQKSGSVYKVSTLSSHTSSASSESGWSMGAPAFDISASQEKRRSLRLRHVAVCTPQRPIRAEDIASLVFGALLFPNAFANNKQCSYNCIMLVRDGSKVIYI